MPLLLWVNSNALLCMCLFVFIIKFCCDCQKKSDASNLVCLIKSISSYHQFCDIEIKLCSEKERNSIAFNGDSRGRYDERCGVGLRKCLCYHVAIIAIARCGNKVIASSFRFHYTIGKFPLWYWEWDSNMKCDEDKVLRLEFAFKTFSCLVIFIRIYLFNDNQALS